MKRLFYAGLLTIAAPAAAQRSQFGLEAGVQFSNFTQKASFTTATGTQAGKAVGDLRTGIRAGFVIDGLIGRDLSLQSGIYFTQKGANTPDGASKYKLSYLEVPLVLLAKARVGTGRLFLGGGPFVALAIGGKYVYSSGSNDLTFGDNVGSAFRLLDGGLLITGGYESKAGLFIRGFANPSLVNAKPGGSGTNSIHHWGYGFSLGYFIH